MNNRILTSLFLLCALMVSTSSCAQIKASKNYVTKDVKVGNFNKIESLCSTTVTYIQSTDGSTKVQVYGSDNLVDLLDISVSKGSLIVKLKKNARISWKDGRLKVIASSPSLEAALLQGSGDINLESDINCNNFSMLLQGSGDINAKNIKSANNVDVRLQGSGDIEVKGGIQAQNVALNLQGSGDLKVVNVTANDVKAQLHGSGDLKINGTTRTATLSLQASGDLDAKNLQAVDVTATLNGSGDLNCYATGTLKVGVNGSGDIGYKGNPSKVELIGGRTRNIRKL